MARLAVESGTIIAQDIAQSANFYRFKSGSLDIIPGSDPRFSLGLTPKVSIVLPVYNGAEFLSASIESVLAQDYSDFELLIADDNSTDQSYAITESFAKRDSRIVCWRNENNLGLFQNYNECIKRSRGEFIKPFAQDDLLHETNLSAGVKVLTENPTVALTANCRAWIDAANTDVSDLVDAPLCNFYLPANRVVAGSEVIRHSLFEVVNFIGEPSCVIFRRQFAEDGFDTAFHHLGDLDYWLRILSDGNDFWYNDATLSYFRIHEQSRSAANIKQLLFAPDLVRLAQRFEPMLIEMGSSYEKLMSRSARALCQHVRYLSATGQVEPNDFRGSSAVEEYLAAIGGTASDENSQHRILSDLCAFRELVLHGALATNQAQSENWRELIEATNRIIKLEARLERLLDSPSWRLTRVLREYNAYSSRNAPIKKHAPDSEKLDDPLTYMHYLQAQIKSVKRSRSWKITRHLRRLGML